MGKAVEKHFLPAGHQQQVKRQGQVEGKSREVQHVGFVRNNVRTAAAVRGQGIQTDVGEHAAADDFRRLGKILDLPPRNPPVRIEILQGRQHGFDFFYRQDAGFAVYG